MEKLTVLGRELKRKQRQAQMQARGLVEERADFLAQLQDQNRELINLRGRLGMAKKENEDLSKLQGCPDLTNKAIYDLDDPDRPRFTTAELKEILHERNELKARVSDLEDELELYRPKPEMYVIYKTQIYINLLLYKIYSCHFCVVSVSRMTKMHLCRDRFLMNQMMHHGKSPLNLEFVNCMCSLFSFLHIVA